MNKGKFSGFEYIKYKHTLFNVKLIINPIHIPIQNNPALGKYANTYPTKNPQTIVNINTFDNTSYGTPGLNTTDCYIVNSTIKAVAHPSITIVTLYI